MLQLEKFQSAWQIYLRNKLISSNAKEGSAICLAMAKFTKIFKKKRVRILRKSHLKIEENRKQKKISELKTRIRNFCGGPHTSAAFLPFGTLVRTLITRCILLLTLIILTYSYYKCVLLVEQHPDRTIKKVRAQAAPH